MNNGIVVLVIALASCAGLTSCTALNQTYDQRKYFVEKRDDEIGKNINDVLTSYHPKFEPKIEKTDVDTKTYFIGDPEYCYWSFRVDSTTKEILDWAYESDPEKCKARKYYSGPW